MNLLTPTYFTKGLGQYNPSPEGCVLNLPLWHPYLSGATFLSADPFRQLCTVTGTVWGSKGRTFDGDDQIDCGNNAVLYTTPNNQWAIEVWFITSTPTQNTTILGKTLSPSSYYIYLDGSGSVGATFRFAASNADTAAMAVSANVWHHLVVEYIPNSLLIYLDGVAGAPTAKTDTLTFYNTENFFIGYRGVGSSFFTSGTIGEVRLYNRGISVSEVQNNRLATRGRYQ